MASEWDIRKGESVCNWNTDVRVIYCVKGISNYIFNKTLTFQKLETIDSESRLKISDQK